MSMSGSQRLQTGLNALSSVKNALEHVRAATGCPLHRIESNWVEGEGLLDQPLHASELDF